VTIKLQVNHPALMISQASKVGRWKLSKKGEGEILYDNRTQHVSSARSKFPAQ
jgi:hypothetical protein